MPQLGGLIAIVAVILLVLTGCGGDDDAEGVLRARAQGKEAAPGVPVSKHGDNSIQTWGVEASSAERNRVTRVVQEYLDARAAEDWQLACEFLAAKQLREHERIGRGAGCAAVMATFAAGESSRALAAAADIDVYSLRVGGGYAFLIYRRPGGMFYATALRQEGKRWGIVTVTPNPIY